MSSLSYATEQRPRLLITAEFRGVSSNVEKARLIVDELRNDRWERTWISQPVTRPEVKFTFNLPVFFGRRQPLRFSLYNASEDQAAMSFPENGYLGKVLLDMSEIASQAAVEYTCTDANDASTIIWVRVSGVVVTGCDQYALFNLVGVNWPRPCRSPSDCRFVLLKRKDSIEEKSWHPIYESELKRSDSPDFGQVRVPWGLLYCTRSDPEFRIEVIRYTKKRSLVAGFIEGKANDLEKSGGNTLEYAVHDASNPESTRGLIRITNFRRSSEPSFITLLRNGVRLKFSVFIDFCNADPHAEGNNHFIGPRGTPRESVAFRAVSNIIDAISNYATPAIDAYGGGLRVPIQGTKAEHDSELKRCRTFFPLTLSVSNRTLNGVDGFRQAYYSVLDMDDEMVRKDICRSTPTRLLCRLVAHEAFRETDSSYMQPSATNVDGTPVGQPGTDEAKQIEPKIDTSGFNLTPKPAHPSGPRTYHIAVMLFDRTYEPLPEYVSQLISSSHLPVSFIYVALPGSSTKKLRDGYVPLPPEISDDRACCCGGGEPAPVTSVGRDGEQAIRDNVHFVDYDAAMQGGLNNLADEILSKIPAQVTDFYYKLAEGRVVMNRVKPLSADELYDAIQN